MKRIVMMLLVLTQAIFFCACSKEEKADNKSTDTAIDTGKENIEKILNLSNNKEQEWTYTDTADTWVLSVVSAVASPELPEQQGVSVCVPGAYVKGIDTDGDGTEDVTADNGTDAVKGSLVIDYDAKITSTNGQTYTAATAPVILNTGAAGYGSQNSSPASTGYAADGYINVACGNRGKQDTVTDDDGNTSYTGDAPSCLADQKAATRYVKYNILLGNLPGSVDYFVSTGGSGGGAHAAMFAATSNNPDFYDYQIEAGAVGVYKNEDGSYSTTVSIEGEDYELSDGAWGCIAYSAITSLYEADMALAFEYYMDTTYQFNTSFQSQLAEYLSAAYMEYINGQNLSVSESAVGFDLNKDGDLDDTVALAIEYDEKGYSETNGYHGTYLDLYLAEFTENLQWYLDNLDYAEGWTWFDKKGNALSDKEVAAYKADIEEINSGDKYGKNIVSLYNPLNYIGAEKTENPTWTKIVMGASEGDMSMLSSLNMQVAWLNAGVDSVIEWQWDGGHVPSEILGNSLSLYVDQMYGKYVEGAVSIEKQKAAAQTENGTAEEMSGTDISDMVNADDLSNISFSLADVVKYRTKGASKAIPAFDVIDYGQEDYVFGDSEADARHWNPFVLEIFEKYGDELKALFNAK